MESKREQLNQIEKQITDLITKGFDSEEADKTEELFNEQMKILQTLDVNQENDRKLMMEKVETNKKLLLMIQEKKEEALSQIGKMADTQDHKKNYDLYK